MLRGDKGYKNYFSDKENRVAYLNIPKCGCSSIKSYLAMISGESYAANEIHKPLFRDVYSRSRAEVKERNTFSFTFVRHPVDRFLSFYKDKIRRWDKNISTQLMDNGFERNMHIDEVIDVLFSCSANELEPHIRPMYMIIYDESGYRVPDFVGKLETFRRDFKVIEKITNIPIVDSRVNESTKRDPQSIVKLTPDQELKVREYFKEDIGAFGYLYS